MNQVALATTLGSIAPFYGIISRKGVLRCECRYVNTCTIRRGKHPRMGVGWKTHATRDLGQIMAWSYQYPDANWGMLTLPHVFAIDFDYRPEQGKYGMDELASVKGFNQEQIENTVCESSGRNPESKHCYFRLPAGTDVTMLISPTPGIELTKGHNILVAGSRHISGRYYRFLPGCSPIEMELVVLPDWLIEHLTKKKKVSAVRVAQQEQAAKDPFKSILEVEPEWKEPPAPGRVLPDFVVMKGIRKDHVARTLFNATPRKNRDLSRDLYHLAQKLAFYTNHNWNQYLKLINRSPLLDLEHKDRKSSGYLSSFLRKAFVTNRFNWQEATGNKKRGRKKSPATELVLDILKRNPQLTCREIAEEAKISPMRVATIVHRANSGFYKDEDE